MTSQLGDVSPSTRKFIETPHRVLINGDWVRPAGADSAPIFDPSTGECVGEYASVDESATTDAIAAARASFESGAWREQTPAARAKMLWHIADLIEANARELAELESIDGGKPFGSAFGGEIPAAAEAFRYHAGWCTKIGGTTFRPSIGGLDLEGSTRLEPIGVAGLITPWNGPLVMAAWKLAPALAAGCSVVLKPAENTPLTTLRLGELICEAGLPAGVVNIVTGGGATVGAAICRDPQVDKISFTGSTQTAKLIIEDSRRNLKRLSLELGGKSPVFIFDDANIDDAIDGAAGGIFSNAGQVCVAGSRILVHQSIFTRVVEGLCAKAQSLRIGRSMDPATEMGPLISAGHRNLVDGFVKQGVRDGAFVAAGGKMVEGPGYFYQPTVMINAPYSSCVWTDEIFGPVAVVASFTDEAQAISMANDSRYGLAASVWTNDTNRAQRASRAIRAGIVWINCHGIPDMAMPIGGYKQSGWGREHGWSGVEAYLESKSVMQRIIQP